eukprot:16449840-Heterocapsa_arctica.AAC.1
MLVFCASLYHDDDQVHPVAPGRPPEGRLQRPLVPGTHYDAIPPDALHDTRMSAAPVPLEVEQRPVLAACVTCCKPAPARQPVSSRGLHGDIIVVLSGQACAHALTCVCRA